jgi:hypothetical protein
MSPVATMREFGAIGRFEFETFDSEVAWVLDRLKSAGIRQAIAVDSTQRQSSSLTVERSSLVRL